MDKGWNEAKEIAEACGLGFANAKRLEHGRFIWPKAESGTVRLSRAQLSIVLEGIGWIRIARTWTPEVTL